MTRPRFGQLTPCFVAVCCLSGLVEITRAQPPAVDLANARLCWEAMEHAGRRLQGTYTLDYSWVPERPTGTGRESGKFLIYDDSCWVQHAIDPAWKEKTVESVMGKHLDYAFVVARRKANGPFLLQYCGPPTQQFERSLYNQLNDRHGCTVPWSANWRPLRAWLDDSHFKIRDPIYETKDGQSCMRIEGSCSPRNDNSDYFYRCTNLVIWVNPSKNWRQVGFHCVCPDLELHGKVEYGADQMGLPVPLKNTFTMVNSSGTYVWTCTYEQWEYISGKLPSNRLGLAAFGIPEPVGSARKEVGHSRTWLWFLGAGLVIGAAAVWHLRKSRRLAHGLLDSGGK